MTEEDWAAAFRPVAPQLPQQPPEQQQQALPEEQPMALPQQQVQDPNLIDTILGSVAEMFMLLEQRTRESLISIIESQEQQGLLLARKFEELERLILNDGELPITNIDALDPDLAEQIRMNMQLDTETTVKMADEPDFMPDLDEGVATGETLEEVEALMLDETYDVGEEFAAQNKIAEMIDEEHPQLLEEALAQKEALSEVVPQDIEQAYHNWKDGNGTFQDFVKAAGGPKGAKKYRELIEE